MNIQIFKSTSNIYKLNREVGESVFNDDGELVEPTNTKNPSIKISADSSILGANLCYIPAFGNRYYFIDSITILYDGIFKVNCGKVDVLKTYSDGVRNSKVLVTNRQGYSKKDLFYNDGTLKTREDITVYQKEFDKFGDGEPVKYILACI